MEREILWAPWRIKYVQGLTGNSECFLCDIIAKPDDDDENLTLWRSAKSIVVLNRYPYNNGHLLIAPLRHVASLEETDDDEKFELIKLVAETQKALSSAIEPHGFNIGANFGRCAGAGLPGHLHIHVVPRWDGDTSFMNVCSDTDVVSQSLIELLEQLKQTSKEKNLPSL